jgi:hypothetical protein
MITRLAEWLWATFWFVLPLLGLSSVPIAIGFFVGGVVLGRATMAKDGLPVKGFVAALLMGATSGVAVWMVQLIYEAWRLAQ